jgi:hypothetical protein
MNTVLQSDAANRKTSVHIRFALYIRLKPGVTGMSETVIHVFESQLRHHFALAVAKKFLMSDGDIVLQYSVQI